MTTSGEETASSRSTPTDYARVCPACFSPVVEGSTACPACGYDESQPGEGGWNLLKPGTILHGRYMVGRTLGQGGFGITYVGMDMLLNVKLAIKEYFPSGLAMRNPDSRTVMRVSEEVAEDFLRGMEKFIDEDRTLARFEGNPCIVSVKDFFEERGTAYMVMTLLEGRTLMAHLKEKGGRLHFGEAFSILSPLMDALDEVHASGLIHRDISPDNIFLTRFGQVKLLDFGASKSAVALIQQRHHSVVLKKGYSPPEQYRGSRRLGPWSDVYGMAATLYRCVVGMVPQDALDRMEEDLLASPISMGIAIPGYAEAALMKALSLSSEDRPQSMRELKEGLLGDAAISAPDAPPGRARRVTRGDSFRLPDRPAKRKHLFTWVFFLLSVAVIGLAALFFIAASDLMRRAKEGDASAQRSIGRLYEFGGIFGSDERAAEWYLEAAMQGDAAAQYALGRLYASDALGLPDYRKASDWYDKAAEQGNIHAQFSLAHLYETGRGRERDDALAAGWYRRAAEQGDARAQFNLARMSEQGRGTRLSLTQAADWYRRAGEQGHAEARMSLARMYEQGRGVDRSESEAALWYRKAAETGDAEAQYIVGGMFEHGRGVEADPSQAASWYLRAAEQGHIAASASLGRLYTEGSGTGRDYAKGVGWYRKAAEAGDAAAQFGLGFCYEFGRGVPRDLDAAAGWYRRAAAQGHTLAGIALDRVLEGRGDGNR